MLSEQTEKRHVLIVGSELFGKLIAEELVPICANLDSLYAMPQSSLEAIQGSNSSETRELDVSYSFDTFPLFFRKLFSKL